MPNETKGLPTIPQTAQEGAPRAKEATQVVNQTPAPVVAPVVDKVAERVASIAAEKAEIELESAKLKLELDKANLVDMKERLAERELKREAVRQNAHTKGAVLNKKAEDEAKHQAHCNHKKGGNGAAGIIGGQGDDSQYAVLKHKFANGDTWVRCLRCGKTWKPPVRSLYKTEAEFERAKDTYTAAFNFQTRNSSSSGVIFGYSDGGEYYREQTANSNLR